LINEDKTIITALINQITMKNFYYIILLSFFVGCKSYSENPLQKQNSLNVEYEVLKVSIETNNSPYNINELRFYKPNSAIDATVMMYQQYGKWKAKYPGKYQDNINQYIWENVQLTDSLKNLTIITDGTETPEAYFTSILIFDSNNQDCLLVDHKDHDKIVKYIVSEIRNTEPKESDYKMIKN